jgi:hypothetical protein
MNLYTTETCLQRTFVLEPTIPLWTGFTVYDSKGSIYMKEFCQIEPRIKFFEQSFDVKMCIQKTKTAILIRFVQQISK